MTTPRPCAGVAGDIAPGDGITVVDVQCLILAVTNVAAGNDQPPACSASPPDPWTYFDLNCDGAINVVDIVQDIYYALHLPLPQATDTNGNGCIDACEGGDFDGDGAADALDCAPADPSIHPGSAESCNGLDSDCSGQVDVTADGVAASCDDAADACGGTCTAAPPPAALFITEIHPVGAVHPATQWIELYNGTSASIGLDRITLRVEGQGAVGLWWIGPTAAAVHPGEWFLLGRTINKGLLGAPADAGWLGSFDLPTSGGTIEVLVDGEVVSRASYGASSPGSAWTLSSLTGLDPLNEQLVLTNATYWTHGGMVEYGTPGAPASSMAQSACAGGTSCDDGMDCTDDACQDGACTHVVSAMCDDGNPCSLDACTGPPPGLCGHDAAGAGVPCDDGNPCTLGDHCRAGGLDCLPGTVVVHCDDNDPCTTDQCLADGSCSHQLAIGQPCDDGDPCTVLTFCDANGQCKGDLLSCDDSDPCTEDTCRPTGAGEVECNHTPLDCADDNACTIDFCVMGGCLHTPLPCFDDNECTDDLCDPSTGCIFNAIANAGIPCDDGSLCTLGDTCQPDGTCAGTPIGCEDGDPCTLDACVAGQCQHTVAPEGAPCDDGSVCTFGDFCHNGACIPLELVHCPAGGPCEQVGCDPVTGCYLQPTPFGATCDDGDPCTQHDACDAAGTCQGTPLCPSDDPCAPQFCEILNGVPTCIAPPSPSCDDGNPCTQDTCAPGAGCVHTPLPDGTVCDSEGPCNTFQCVAGTCMPASPCDDGNPCTEDSCLDGVHCMHGILPDATPCSDGDPCTQGDHCSGGQCVGVPAICDDGNDCTDDACDPQTGCVFAALTGIACDDGDACTTSDACAQGTCVGVAITCDDGDPCTTDTCTSNGSGVPMCSHASTSCDDDNPCTTDGCDPSQGCFHLAICDDGNACTHDACSTDAAGTPHCTHEITPGFTCDDGNPCTVEDICDASGQCAGKPEDGIPCGDETACILEGKCQGGVCSGGKPRPDGTPCVGPKPCTPYACVGGVCQETGPTTCDDNNPCTLDACDVAANHCFHAALTGPSCDDGDPCTHDECLDGTCTAVENPCDDGHACTLDECDPATGDCKHTVTVGSPCDDGDLCTVNDRCDAHGECLAGVPLSCDDGNACTDDPCLPSIGCGAHPLKDCDDGAWCTDDSCDPAQGCEHSLSPQCDDANPCTTDTCHYWPLNPTLGVWSCAHTPVPDGTLCNDGDLCIDVRCLGGTCSDEHGLVNCDDGNPCTLDTCSSSTGCIHLNQPAGGVCSDGNPCTEKDHCDANGVCVGQPVSCDDGDPCTQDICVPGNATGAKSCQHQPTVCDDGLDCTWDWCEPGVGCIAEDACPPDQCTAQRCDDSTGQCVPSGAAPAGTPCDTDQSVCTIEKCNAAGACVLEGEIDCAFGDACITGTCDPLKGCINQVIDPPPATCDDGNACTVGDHCDPAKTGKCLSGTPLQCDDGNPCTDDSCDVETGCTFGYNADSCDDGDPCTLGDTCSAGQCSGTSRDCDDGNPCTDDACDPATGTCVHTPNTNPCNAGLPCWQGVCTLGTCLPDHTLQPPPSGCEEAPSDVCMAVGSAGSTVTCTLELARIADTAPAPNGVHFELLWPSAQLQLKSVTQTGASPPDNYVQPGSHTYVAAGVNFPAAVSSAGSGAAPAGSDAAIVSVGPQPTQPQASISAAYLNNGAVTDPSGVQGAFVTFEVQLLQDVSGFAPVFVGVRGVGGVGVATSSGPGIPLEGFVWQGHTLVVHPACGAGGIVCDDGLPCTQDACDTTTGACHFTPTGAACNDGDPCTQGDVCVGRHCKGRVPTACHDGNPCTADACDPAQGCVFAPQTGPCDDGDVCTVGDQCSQGTCQPGAPNPCDDGAACTSDGCGTFTTLGDDGTPIQHYGCYHVADDAQCDDAEPCTTDSCELGLGCTHLPVADGTPCDDNDECTLATACSTGRCALVLSVLDCTQSAPECAQPYCDPQAGCLYAPDDGACDDAQPCTLDSCTADTMTCTHMPAGDGTTCDDGLACTEDDVCQSGVCVGTAAQCDDANPCTVDTCDDATGCHHDPTGNEGQACNDGNPCTVGDICHYGVCVGQSYAPTCSGYGEVLCRLSGTQGQEIACPLRLARAHSLVDEPMALQFDLFYDSARATPQAFTNLAGGDVPPASLDTGHFVTYNPSAVSDWLGSARVVVAHPGAYTPITTAYIEPGPAQHIAGNADFAVLVFKLAADVPASDPVEVRVAQILAANAAAIGMPGWVLDNGTQPPTMIVGHSNGCYELGATGDCTGDPAQGSVCSVFPGTPCDDANPCTLDLCASAPSAHCAYQPTNVGVACFDGDVCTDNDVCQPDGTCAGTPKTCADDGNPCTLETCDKGLCVTTIASDGTPCGGCGSACVDGQCVSAGASLQVTMIPDTYVTGVAQRRDGRYVLVGARHGLNKGTETFTCWMALTKPNSPLIEQEWTGAGCSAKWASNQILRSVQVTPDDGWIVVGGVFDWQGASSFNEAWLTHFDSTGQEVTSIPVYVGSGRLSPVVPRDPSGWIFGLAGWFLDGSILYSRFEQHYFPGLDWMPCGQNTPPGWYCGMPSGPPGYLGYSWDHPANGAAAVMLQGRVWTFSDARSVGLLPVASSNGGAANLGARLFVWNHHDAEYRRVDWTPSNTAGSIAWLDGALDASGEAWAVWLETAKAGGVVHGAPWSALDEGLPGFTSPALQHASASLCAVGLGTQAGFVVGVAGGSIVKTVSKGTLPPGPTGVTSGLYVLAGPSSLTSVGGTAMATPPFLLSEAYGLSSIVGTYDVPPGTTSLWGYTWLFDCTRSFYDRAVAFAGVQAVVLTDQYGFQHDENGDGFFAIIPLLPDCNDDDPCTTDVCLPDGGCDHDPIPGCTASAAECQTNAECDDADDFTRDACTAGGKCLHWRTWEDWIGPACDPPGSFACDAGSYLP